MDNANRFERSLAQALAVPDGVDCPPQLISALRYAVIPGGARIRPKLCLAVARACGDEWPSVSLAVASSIEILHCASLVHDDLPCFDAADLRRGRPSVHKAFGERLAVLTGDALIVLAFQTLGRVAASAPDRLAPLMAIIARAVGACHGITGGQAWECEPSIPLRTYQRAKTGALFAAATAAGACAARHDAAGWSEVGELIGEAYQVADDIRDVYSSEQDMGKPAGQDRVLGRPNVVHELGIAASVQHLEQLVRGAMDSVPACRGAATCARTSSARPRGCCRASWRDPPPDANP